MEGMSKDTGPELKPTQSLTQEVGGGGGKLSLRRAAVPENTGTRLSWDKVLEGKHSSVHTQTSPNQHFTPGTVLWGQDCRHLPLTLREPSPSVFPEQGTASCSQSNREGRRGKGGRPPSRHCHFSCCLATRESRSGSEKSPDHLCPISSGEWAVCVEYLDLESGGQN